MPNPTYLRGEPASRVIITVPTELVSRVDRLAMPFAGGRAEFTRQALIERVERLERLDDKAGSIPDQLRHSAGT